MKFSGEVLSLKETSTPLLLILMIEAVRASVTAVYFNEMIQRYIPEGYHLHFTACIHYSSSNGITSSGRIHLHPWT
jgi:hypothetical protein